MTLQWNIYSVKAFIDDDVDMDDETVEMLEEDYIDIDGNKVDSKLPLKVSARNAIAIDAESRQVLWNQKDMKLSQWPVLLRF